MLQSSSVIFLSRISSLTVGIMLATGRSSWSNYRKSNCNRRLCLVGNKRIKHKVALQMGWSQIYWKRNENPTELQSFITFYISYRAVVNRYCVWHTWAFNSWRKSPAEVRTVPRRMRGLEMGCSGKTTLLIFVPIRTDINVENHKWMMLTIDNFISYINGLLWYTVMILFNSTSLTIFFSIHESLFFINKSHLFCTNFKKSKYNYKICVSFTDHSVAR